MVLTFLSGVVEVVAGGGGVADLGEGDHNYAPSRSTCDCEQEIDLYEKELT